MNKVPDVIPGPLSAAKERSFAYRTIKDRLPIILSKTVDTLVREKCEILTEYGKKHSQELKDVIGRLSKLKNEIQTNKDVVPLQDDRDDADAWNKCIAEETDKNGGVPPTWFASAWLLVECYMYRRIQEALELSSCPMKSFDPFFGQKRDSFRASLDTIRVVATRILAVGQTANGTEAKFLDYDTLRRFLLLDLWGNKCDLSISAGSTDVTSNAVPPSELDSLTPNILVDQSDLIWAVLRSDATTRVDFVLDNAGFELFSDLCLADIVCSLGAVRSVHFHAKQMPWFVSDTTPADFEWTLDSLASEGTEPLSRLASRWRTYLEKGQWHVHTHPYWTLPHDYARMAELAPDLYRHLGRSHLIVFKGDLNYRKLTGDLEWDHTVSFAESLRGFGPAPLCTLRTIKADVVVGLRHGQAQATRQLQKNWMTSGDFALIQFSDNAVTTSETNSN